MKQKTAYTVSLLMVILIFIADVFTPLGFSTWILYALPLLIVSSTAKTRGIVISFTAAITLLIITALFLSPPGIKPTIAPINRTLGIAALWALSLFNFNQKRIEREIKGQSELLNSANRALSESETNLRTIFDSSHDAIVIHELNGRIIDVNKKMLEMYRVEYNQALSLSIREDYSMPDNPVDAVPQIWQKAVSGENQLFEWKCRRPGDGSMFEGEVFVRKITLNDKDVILANIRDISERKKSQSELETAYRDMERRVQERTSELEQSNGDLRLQIMEREKSEARLKRSKELSDALNRINALINSTLDPDEIMKKVVVEAALAIGCESSALDTLSEGKWTIRYVYNFPEESIGRNFNNADVPFVEIAVRTKKPVIVKDSFSDPRAKPEVQKAYGVRSVMTIPLMVKGAAFGALFFNYHSRITDFTAEQIDFANKLAISVSLSLENARLYQSLQESWKLSDTRLKQLQNIYETAPVGLCFVDRNLRFVSINKELAGMNAVPIAETIGRTIREVLPEWAEVLEGFCRRAMETGKPVADIEISWRSGAGSEIAALADYYPIKDHAEAILGVNIVVQDITLRKHAEEALQANERRLKAILNTIPDMAWLKDSESRFILVNDAYGRSSGKDPDELIGKTDFDIWPKNLAEQYRADDREVMEKSIQKRIEEPLVDKDGAVSLIEAIKTPVKSDQGKIIGTVGIARDITDRKRMEEEIRRMALHDALTGLPNRRLFLDLLKLELAQSRRHKRKLAVLFLDLDRFKEINDTLGHDAGDRLLKEVAGTLRATLRESDTVARIGGDEFNMILADITQADDMSDIALKIVASIRKPIVLDGHELHISTSVGISIYPDDSEEIDTLLRYADIAMYHAKETGRNTFRFYNSSINVRSIERMRMESRLRQAIARGQLSVHYQPQIDIKTKKIFYAEALIRWNHPERGLLEPKDFLPLAEETGFITSIDEWVLKTVCTQARSWKESGFDSFCITVNFSARQFQSPDLVAMVSGVLKDTGMSPACLDIEVTENTAMSNIERTASQLRELTKMGVHISIDDFGTGYSSLNYLKKLPIERIKIDKSFIRDIATDPDDRAIISAVASMARQMGIRTVAEGVETEEQLAFVKAAGCDEVQGFLLSRPVSPERFGELMVSGR